MREESALKSELSDLAKMLEEAGQFNVSEEPEEKDVFSLGGRGHYENPISDLLAFFMNPMEQHQFGDLFLESLAECIDGGEKINFLDVEPPAREECTANGKRIDLLIRSDNMVMIIENKIYHWLANPLDEYMQHVDGWDSSKKQFSQKYLVVLALSPEVPPIFDETKKAAAKKGWNLFYVSYRKYLDALNKNVGYYLMRATNNKWLVIMREFELNLERMIKMAKPMEQGAVNFVTENIPKIISVQNLWNDYLSYITQKVVSEIFQSDTTRISVFRHNWGFGTALRFYDRDKWRDNANVTLIVVHESGSYMVSIYVPGVQESEVEQINKLFNPDRKYEEAWEPESKKTFRRLWIKEEDAWTKLPEALAEVQKVVGIMNQRFAKACDCSNNTV